MLNYMRNSIDAYIADHELSWAPSTLKSERHRLYSVGDLLTGDPLALWTSLQVLKPYSRVTTWTRVVSFWSWLYPTEGNPYEQFRKKNARLFKHTYQPKEVGVSFEDAKRLIDSIPNESDRAFALNILGSGERLSEARQSIGAEKGGRVVGKGSKGRTVFRPEQSDFFRSMSSFRRALALVGLRPHDLRKLCATRLVEMGMNEADLLRVMGWSNIATAKVYLQPKKDAEIKSIFNRLHAELV